MPSVSSRLIGQMRHVLTAIVDDDPFHPLNTDSLRVEATRLLMLLPRPAIKKTLRTRKEDKASKRAKHREDTGRIREAVMERSGGKCEACGMVARGLSLDHFYGGSGRRRQQQSTTTTWALCRGCDNDRTNNKPSAACWNDIFALHCNRHGFEFHPHITRSTGTGKARRR